MPLQHRPFPDRAQKLRTTFCSRSLTLPLRLVAVVSVLLLSGCATTAPPPSGPCGGGEAAPPPPNVAVPITPPVEASGVVYVGYASIPTPGFLDPVPNLNHVAAVRTSDGTVLWKQTVPGSLRTQALALVVADDTLLLLTPRMLVALRTRDGSLRWQLVRSVSWRATPVVRGGILYSLDETGLSAIRVADGQILWQIASLNVPGALPTTSPYYGYYAPYDLGLLVAGGVVYVGSLNGSLGAVRASDGARLWQVVAVPPEQVQAAVAQGQGLATSLDPVALVGDVLYVRVGSKDVANAVLLVRTSDGMVVGHVHAPPEGPGTAGGAVVVTGYAFDPVVLGGTLYIGLTWGYTYALQTVDGQRLWQLSLSGATAQVAAQDDGVILLDDAVVAAHMAGPGTGPGTGTGSTRGGQLADDGTVLWRLRQLTASMALGGGHLYVGESGVAYCTGDIHFPDLQTFNEADGQLVWTRALTTAG